MGRLAHKLKEPEQLIGAAEFSKPASCKDEKVYVGIDISKDSLDVAVHASDKQWRYSNDRAWDHQLVQDAC